MIVYRCDRCGQETTLEKFYGVELVFTPRSLDGGEDVDNESRDPLGQLCNDCSDAIAIHMKRLFAPETDEQVPPHRQEGA